MAAEHLVFTYQDPASLGSQVGAWLSPTLRRGGGALLACTPGHATLARAQLRQEGIDVEACEREGRLVVGDADDLLARFMVSGMPNGRAFKRVARGLLGGIRAASAPGPIRVWGELVDVLARRGQLDAADRLERLWNEILAEDHVELLCSYDLDALDPGAHARVLLDVCCTHSRLCSEDGDALDAAVADALRDVFGPEQATLLRRILPTRARLLERMSAGSAILVSLRSLDAGVGAEVHRRARLHMTRPVTIPGPRIAPR